MLLVFGCNLASITQDMAVALIYQPQNLFALLPSCRGVNADSVQVWSSVTAREAVFIACSCVSIRGL